jgi:hypothetical protein
MVRGEEEVQKGCQMSLGDEIDVVTRTSGGTHASVDGLRIAINSFEVLFRVSATIVRG